jgi:hypothetical protein
MLLKFALWVIQHSKLTIAERTLCTGVILDKLEALPLSAILSDSDEGILINGKPLDFDKLQVLRNSAKAAIENQAINLIAEQVVWIATDRVIRKALTPEELYFYRAAIWFSEQMKQQLQSLAQANPELPGQED